MYANPSKAEDLKLWNYSHSASSGVREVRIYDLSGQLRSTMAYPVQEKVHGLSPQKKDLSAGHYILQVNEGRSTAIKKLIIR